MAKKAKTQPAVAAGPRALIDQIKNAKIEVRPLHDLMPYARNSRVHADWQVAKIAASIREFGFNNPVLIEPNGTIIAGHARVMAAHKLDLAEVPCVVLSHLTPTQRKAYVIADNQLATLSTWDDEMLKVELDELKIEGFDVTLTGIDDLHLGGTGDGSGGDGEGADGDGIYTKKIVVPTYEPTGENPPVSSLVDREKTVALVAEINASDIPDDVRSFLVMAAERHAVFNYELIAEFYAHAPPALQALMEHSALVIIDFEKAIERGFVRMSDKIAEAWIDSEKAQ